MKGIAWQILLVVLLFASAGADAQRTSECLNFGWEFRLDDEADWRRVDVPHDFQIEMPWAVPANADAPANSAANPDPLASRGFKAMGKGYYRRHLTPTDDMRDRRVLLDFEGVLYTADVYLNGERIGGTDYGYVGFEIDISGALRYGEDNLIEVVADTRQPENSRWYTGAGLYRNVSLVTTPKELFFNRHPLRITTRDNRYVSVSAEFTNLMRGFTTRVVLTIDDDEGKCVYSDTIDVRRFSSARHQEARLVTDIDIKDARLWDIDTPYLYNIRAKLLRSDGTVADEAADHFGFRTIEFGPDFGFRLNGRKVLLKGCADHHSLGALGAAAYPKAIEKRIRLLKQFGMNHIRTSHNPYSRDFIRLCDEMGILVVDELYDKWTQKHTGGKIPFEHHWQEEVPEWVKRDRNSPSVILWSLGNELQQETNMPFNDFGVTMYRLQKTLLQRYDTTRLVTVAMHPRYRNWRTDSLPPDLALETDIQSYNYRYAYFPIDGKHFPWMTFYQSEAAVVGMPQNYFDMDLDRVVGLAYWGAIDYLGESVGWPMKGWGGGVFDITLEPRDKAYLMKSMFKPDEPLVHIAPNEAKQQILTYTNADEVELFIDGKSAGRQSNPKTDPARRNQILWTLGEPNGAATPHPSRGGVAEGRGGVSNLALSTLCLEAVAYHDGKVVARHRIDPPGKAVALRVTPEDTGWCADGTDLMHLRIEAIDSKGRRVTTASDELTFALDGDARLIAVSNGDMRSNEPNVATRRSLYRGSALVILRAGTTPSKVSLSTSAAALKPVTTVLRTSPRGVL